MKNSKVIILSSIFIFSFQTHRAVSTIAQSFNPGKKKVKMFETIPQTPSEEENISDDNYSMNFVTKTTGEPVPGAEVFSSQEPGE